MNAAFTSKRPNNNNNKKIIMKKVKVAISVNAQLVILINRVSTGILYN